MSCPDWLRISLADLEAEASAAERRYGAFRSPHEAYGVIAEEMAELLDEIRRNDDGAARREALQVAAVAFRFARDGWHRGDAAG